MYLVSVVQAGRGRGVVARGRAGGPPARGGVANRAARGGVAGGRGAARQPARGGARAKGSLPGERTAFAFDHSYLTRLFLFLAVLLAVA